MIRFKVCLLVLMSSLLIGVMDAEVVTSKISYSYRLGSEGYIYTTVFIDDVEDQHIIYVKVEESVVEESLVVFNDFNDLLPAELVNSNLILIYNINNSKKVIVNYIAKAANVSEAYINAVITPNGPSKVLLPRSSALLYFNGSADISFTDTTITLTYNEGGTYLISYIPLTFVISNVSNLTTPITITNKTAVEQVPGLQPIIHYLLGASLVFLGGLAYYMLKRRRVRYSEIRKEEDVEQLKIEALRSEVDERDIEILKAIAAKELTISGLARELRLSKSVAWRRIRKLSHLKLITTADMNGKTYIKITSLGKKILEEAGKT